MNARHLFPNIYEQYSNGKLTKNELKMAALNEAEKIGFGKTHRMKKFFLNTLLLATRTIGYSATALVGMSVLVPGFLSIDILFSRVDPTLKYLYTYSLVFGATGLGLTSYYIGRATQNISTSISKKIEFVKTLEKTSSKDAVEAFMKEIAEAEKNSR